MDIYKEMKHYDLLHQMDSQKNYLRNNDCQTKENKKILAEFIHNNYDKLDDNELKIIAMKCLTSNEIKKILLSYELKYHDEETYDKMSLDEFTKKATYYLNRYQCRAGGFFIEDQEWSIYRYDDNELGLDIKENEVLFENTVFITYSNDYETVKYLDNLVDKLNSIASNISVELRENKEGKIVHLLLWATDNDMDVENIVSL